MAKKVKKIQEDVQTSAQKIWMAGLGALATAEEEGSKLFKNLVEKGETFEKRFDAPVGKVKGQVDDARGRVEDVVGKLEGSLNDRITAVLTKMGVPTKDEINRLTERVEALMDSIEKMQEAQADDSKSSDAKSTTKSKTAAKSTASKS